MQIDDDDSSEIGLISDSGHAGAVLLPGTKRRRISAKYLLVRMVRRRFLGRRRGVFL